MTKVSNTIAIIEKNLSAMTEVEAQIAQYFTTHALTADDLSSQQVAMDLHVSQAALTRFAKKCGFSGYRAFIFEYLNSRDSVEQSFEHLKHPLTKRVLLDYDDITQQSHQLIDEDQLQRIAELIEEADRVYFFGQGSSGLVAREMKLRLMRLGVICEALTDQESFAWTISILDPKCLVIGFSLSGSTMTVLNSLTAAKEKGAKTVLFSTQAADHKEEYTETVTLASVPHLDYGNRISPQFPMLILLDILYAYFLEINREQKEAIFNAYTFPPANQKV
ncbi:MurR/RpiR family transcriptional regulator [Streptococcus moroccensis]|uniref:DNA-binding MurR/RpiR family transcriptional regulator n=1 Tax=Streptococcus moroccensis TaxID=1451356 RepID=A0ABT9YQV9_9STRE|nr:MurR/RpiR family transcriptional regulator [Streptococcus moroccensis]MDQ0222383.1 DNA-binding MurR/RpiR family transcriptional regulator [Streptococcus moroccensis]